MSTLNADRLKQIQEIGEIISNCESQLNDLLTKFGWSKDGLQAKQFKSTQIQPVKCDKEQIFVNKSQRGNSSKDANVDFDALANLCATIDKKSMESINYADINKLKRDLKRRRIKYRTTKTAPLTYTEELRELINLQMELVKERK